MSEKVKNTITGILAIGVAYVGIPAGAVFLGSEDCQTVDVPYSTEIRHESRARSDNNPEKEITQHGKNGATEKCVKKFGGDTREKVLSKPITEIITYYDYYEPYNSYIPESTYQPTTNFNSVNTYQTTAPASDGVRTGAMCNDGTTSSATGRGACSRHGGVNYWLTN